MTEKDENYFLIRRWIDELDKIDAEFQSIDSPDENFWVLYKKGRNLQESIKRKLNKPYKITDKNLATKVTKVFNREYSINKFEESIHRLAYEDFDCLDEFNPTTCHLPHDGAIDIIGTLENGENWFESEVSYYKGDDPSEGFLYQLYSDLRNITRNIKRRSGDIGTVFTGYELPGMYLDHLYEIRNSFSLGLYRSAMVFCRAVLECAIFDRLKTRGELPYNIVPDKIQFQALINEAKKNKLLDKQSFDKVEHVKEEVDSLLHKKEPVPVDAGKAYHCIRNTFYILTQMFKPF